MSKLKRAKTFAKKATALATVFGMAASLMPAVPMQVKAADFTGQLTEVKSVAADSKDKNVVWVTFNNDVKGKITFLEDGIFRYNVDPSGQFSKYAVPNSASHLGRIPQYPDESGKYSHPEAAVTSSADAFTVKSGDVSIIFDKATAKMTIKEKDATVMEEKAAISLSTGGTVQTVKKQKGENFYGGGTQNGRFVHTGEVIYISNNGWTDGGVASPNPFYYTTNGYGVLRNTFKTGNYDFGKSNPEAVVATHGGENEFDAYYFVAEPGNGRNVTQEILRDYYKVTGNPALAPEYSFYVGHLNAYNRDQWSDTNITSDTARTTSWTIKGTDPASSAGVTRYETGMSDTFVLQAGMQVESLNGKKPTVALDNYPNVTTPRKYSAQAVIDQYEEFDMPLGFFLPNDGYGAGYGQNGYNMTGGVNADGTSSAARIAAVDANVANLKEFADYAKSKGVETGLWTQSYLVPDSNSSTYWHRLRDFRKEVKAGVTTLKTDVAWVGPGYSMQLDGVKTAYDIATEESNVRPNIISLCGWAGSQRYNGIWTGDQYGGNWEYIRFHIPTYIGTSLSGNPNIGSDMDGIFAGSPLITVRDYQWKTFTQSMLNMDGWGAYAKMPYTFGDPYTGINRMYLKIKSQLMPYLYTTAYSASNIDVGNNDTGLPMVRAMHLEYPDEPYAYSKSMQYQYMYGKNVLVAPVYQDTDAKANGDDIRNNIFLPGKDNIWVDFFTGKQYKGGQNLSGYDAPVWKLPAFVKNGAIIPQYEANNNPNEINKANRIVEFWPEGNTDYTAVEDNGKAVQNQTENDPDYGVIENVSYGTNVKTKYTSSVSGTKAVLKAEKSTGSYTGYQRNKNTTFIVHVSKEPAGIVAKNGTSTLDVQKAASKDAFDKASPAAGQAVWFYDANPKIETFASEKETQFKAMVADVKVAPKLYVKFASVDAQASDQTLEINGFENKGDFPADKENKDLAVPVLTEEEDAKTATSISMNWTAVEGAQSYELLIDGVLNSLGTALSYTHTDLAYASSHTYQVRARNENGYSAWSAEQTFTSDANPWKDTPIPKNITWPGGIYSDRTADKAFDQILQAGDGGFHSDTGGGSKGVGIPLTVEYEKAYKLDKIEYYPRTEGTNGIVTKMKLETSLDGVHWKEEGTYTWQQNAATKTMQLENTAARFIRFTALAAVENFFSASEIKVYAAANSKGFAVGSADGHEEMEEGDFQNLNQYKGSSEKDALFENQVRGRYCDININGYYDAYDYAFTMFQLDGGTQKTGSVGGASTVTASKEQVAEGEEFTLSFQASDASNVNALGQIISYDPSKVRFVSVEGAPAISQMMDLSANKVYDDGTAYVNIAFANRGDKALYSGSDTLVTLKMEAKEAISTGDENVINLYGLVLIGPDYSTNGEIASDTFKPIRQYKQEDFNITLTNEELPTDDGTNVGKLIQQKSYDALFNGTIENDRGFEFLWNVEDNFVPGTGALPAYVTLPVTMHFALKNPGTIGKVVVHNANKANGYATSVKAEAIYEDGTSSGEYTITLNEVNQAGYDTFTFSDMFDFTKKVARVDVTVLKAIGSNDADVSNMLTLSEIQLFEAGEVDPDYVPPIGPDDPDPEHPLAPGKKYVQNDFDITMINDVLPTDDGTNVQKMIQQAEGYDGLFNGSYGEPKESTQDTNYREFELKWDVESNYVDGKLPDYIKVPSTIHLAMKNPGPVSQIIVRNAGRRNGYVSAISAKVNYEDGSSSKDRIRKLPGDKFEEYQDFSALTLKYAENKNVKSVDITILRTYGMGGNISPNMMTLAELEVYGVLDRSELQDIYNQYKNTANPDSLYTAATWAGFEKALKAVEDLLESDDQAAIDKAIADLEKAYGALKTNREVLQSEYEKQNKLSNNGSYTKESWDVFQKALNAAKELLENEASTGTDMEAALTDLQNASKALVRINRSNLMAELSKYEGLLNDDGTYTAASWEAFQAVVKSARDVLDNLEATQQAIDEAADSLAPAFEKLVLSSDFVKDETAKLESSVTNTDNTYTAESWSAYQAALAAVKEKLAQGAAPAELNQAYAALEKAYQALTKAAVQPPAPGPAEGLKKNQKHSYKNVVYKVLNVSKKTVAACGLANKNAKSVTIQQTVKINGVNCKVVEISANAFKGAKKLQAVVIGKNVTTIGANAFNNCKALKKVTFKATSVPTIKSGAFKKVKTGITVNVPKKMKKAKRNQLSKKLSNVGMKKLKLKAK